ncbi:MAG: cell division protein FtsA [Candidatus Latescibacteria bacterium]|jgi:cell division protein FtsA|nr:cell division protein FtsA [Candidatus Latescibacterota bacterium]
MSKKDFRVGLDIGTTKVAAVVAQMDDNEVPTIIGVGTSPCEGLRRGVVVDLEKTVEAINVAVTDAERMADVEIREAYVGIAGDHIKSLNSRGVIAVSRADHTITQKDIDRVIDAARAIRLPDERQILHVIPQEYIVDNQDGIKNPLDISGVRLEAEVHIVTSTITSMQNVVKCVNRAGIEVEEFVLEPLASSLSILTPDEKEIGCALLDIGGGTTDLAVFHEEAIRFSSIIGFGGKNVTTDIAIGLRTPVEHAESIKVEHGCTLRSMIPKDKTIEVPSAGDREPRNMSLEILGTIIEPRMEEIFTLAKQEIEKNNFTKLLGAGVVLTGGASLLQGSAELAEQIFDMPVKVGYPRGLKGLTDIIENPSYATVLGLILYKDKASGGTEKFTRRGASGFWGIVGNNFRKWFKDFI